MKRLTIKESKSAFDLISEKKMREIIAGDGFITSGSGTEEDPYVIESTIYVNSSTFSSSSLASAQNGVQEFNDMGAKKVDGVYYSFNVTTCNYGGSTGGTIPGQHTYNTENGPVAVHDTSLTGLNGTPTDSNGNPIFGHQNDANNATGVYMQNISGYSGAGIDIVEKAVAHELAHTFGLNDGDNVAIMNSFSSDGSGTITSGPGGMTKAALKKMLESGRIHWMSGVRDTQ